MTPRYLVYDVHEDCAYPFDTLAAALEHKSKHGGMVYEPLGMTMAEKVFKERNDDAYPAGYDDGGEGIMGGN